MADQQTVVNQGICDCGVSILKKLQNYSPANCSKTNTPGIGRDEFSFVEQLSPKEATTSNKQLSLDERDWSEFEGKYAKDLVSLDGVPKAQQFLTETLSILLQYLQQQCDPSTKVLDFHHPHQLREIMDHCLDVHETPRDLEQILSDCKETLKYCVKSGHPHFFNQLSTAHDFVGLAGEWLSSAANNNMMTYEVAPVFTLMEIVILNRMRAMIGWSDGDGTFAPGGAISNFYGMLAARQKVCPDVKHKGLFSTQELVVFTSEQSHFSIRRAAILLGIGLNNVVQVDVDRRGKMKPKDLEDKIIAAKKSGKLPFFVNAMCGTTVLGAFDPINDVADVCEKYGIWLHADGAWGGTVLFSKEHKYLLNGLERVDSMTWNPHKMMNVPLQCSVILLKEKGLLSSANKLGAEYLYQKDKHYDVSYDTGDKAIQCGRHNDIFKLWLMWRSKGDNGFEEHVDKLFYLATYLRDCLKERESFELVNEEFEAPNVCFWYIPPAIKTMQPGSERDEKLNKVAPKLKALMMEKGSMLIQYQPLGKLPNFFRVAISNPWYSTSDLDFMLDELERLGAEL